MTIRTYAYVPAIVACSVLLCCISTPQSISPTVSGTNNKVESRQKQSVLDLGKEQVTKPEVSGSQNKTITNVNDPKVLYGVMGLMALMIAGMFHQQRKAHTYQKRRVDFMGGSGR